MSLFEYYRGDSGASKEAGDSAASLQTTYSTLQSNLDGRSAAASDETQYDIKDPVANASATPEAGSGELGSASLLAGGAIRHFAMAICTYDGHIDELNTEYETAKSHDFYATGLCTPEGIEEASQSDIDAAGASLRSRLEDKRKGYEGDLDDAADFAGGLLKDGPSDETLVSLFISGDLTAEEVAHATGQTIATLNTMRMIAATSNFVLTSPSWVRSFTRYMFKLGPGGLHSATTSPEIIAQVRQIMKDHGMKPGDAKAFYRGQNMTNAARPGYLFGKYGANSKWFGPISKWAGRILSPAAVVVGGVGLYNTIDQWDTLATDEKINGVVGNSAFMVSGGLGTAALIMGAAFPPALAAVAIGAGVVALGSMVYQYREEIWDAAQWTGDKIADGASWLYDNSGLDSVVDGVSEGVSDFVDDPGGTIKDGLDAITPW
ncbi:hypothetical protein [Solicola gregarius]|uniref:Uncharacterized protein n=1 Tax=Solicola gregarius TaxID=2908642 RepID=A0AA46TI40_9ACTN|nr:hypothetical protein [Solicola gregarius]UYM04928.1 hypothetical protein L0C25_20770 [Solicola gregarius]